MKILTYNIKDGGLDSGGDRFDALAAVIRAAGADAVCLMEANGFYPVGLRDRSSARFHEFSRAIRMAGLVLHAPSGYDLAVFVRPGHGVESAEPARGDFHHGALCVTMQAGSDRPLLLIATHLHPFSSIQRAAEAECLAWYASHFEGQAHVVLAGDMNSLSPGDRETGHLPSEPGPDWPVRLLDVRGQPDTVPLALLERTGLVDCYRRRNTSEAGATDPTPAFAKKGDLACRLDFIMAGPSAAARLKACDVFRPSQAATASDHYPVLAEFEL